MSAARPLFLRSRACNRYLLSGLSSEEEPGLLLLLPQLKTWSWGSRGRNKVTQTEKKRVYRKACPSPPPRAPFQLLVSVSWNSLLPKKKNTHLQDKLMIVNLQRRWDSTERSVALARECTYFTWGRSKQGIRYGGLWPRECRQCRQPNVTFPGVCNQVEEGQLNCQASLVARCNWVSYPETW